MGLFQPNPERQAYREAKRDCRTMCDGNYGFDRDLKSACRKSCRGEIPPQTPEDFVSLIGESNYLMYISDEQLVVNSASQRQGPNFLLIGLGVLVVGLVGYFLIKK
ncbi:MAG: hypothetical protein AAFW00_19825 [Bacteroidota bacterium]